MILLLDVFGVDGINGIFKAFFLMQQYQSTYEGHFIYDPAAPAFNLFL